MRNATGAVACAALLLVAPAAAQDSPELGLLGRTVAEDVPTRWVGDPAPVAGHVTLLRWWTDGCPHCALSLPAIEALRTRYADRGLVTVGVYHPKPPRKVTDETVARAAEGLGYHGPVAVDEEWKSLRRIWLDTGERDATSASFLLDPKGRIRFVHAGPEIHPSEAEGHESCAADYARLVDAIEEELALAEPPTVSAESLLAEFADRRALARLPSPWYVVHGKTSEDGGPLDLEGPGAAFRLVSHAPKAVYRVQVDGSDPLPLTLDENGALLPPIPFADRCRISKDSDSEGSFVVEYRAYAEPTSVDPPTAESLAALAPAVESARARLGHPGQGTDALGATTFTYTLSEEVPEGAFLCTDPGNASGPRAITELFLRAEATDLVPALRRAVLRMSFDGEETVACPLGDFFADFGGVDPFESRPITVAPGADEAIGHPGTQVDLVCRFVMPYREGFTFVIDARHAGDLHVAGSVRTEPWDWDARSMYFHASWSSRTVAASKWVDDWVRCGIKGRGLLVGEAVSDEGTQRRFRDADAIPFDTGITLSTGYLSTWDGLHSVAATTYYYARPGAKDDAPTVDVSSRPPR